MLRTALTTALLASGAPAAAQAHATFGVRDGQGRDFTVTDVASGAMTVRSVAMVPPHKWDSWKAGTPALVTVAGTTKRKPKTWGLLKLLASSLAKELISKKSPAVQGLRQMRDDAPMLLEVVRQVHHGAAGEESTPFSGIVEDKRVGRVRRAIDNLLSAAGAASGDCDAPSVLSARTSLGESKISVDAIQSAVSHVSFLSQDLQHHGDDEDDVQAKKDKDQHVLHLHKRWERRENFSESDFAFGCDVQRVKFLKQLYISDMRKSATNSLLFCIQRSMMCVKERTTVFMHLQQLQRQIQHHNQAQEGNVAATFVTRADDTGAADCLAATKNDRARTRQMQTHFIDDVWITRIVNDAYAASKASEATSKLVKGMRRSTCLSRVFVDITSEIPILYGSSRLLHAMPQGLGGLHIGRSSGSDSSSWNHLHGDLGSNGFKHRLRHSGWTLMMAVADQYHRAFAAFHEAREEFDRELERMLASDSIAVPISDSSAAGAGNDAVIEEGAHVASGVTSYVSDNFQRILTEAMFYATNGQLDLSPSFLVGISENFLPEVASRFPSLKRPTNSPYPAPFHSYECFLMCLHEADRRMPLALARRPLHERPAHS